MKVRLVYSDGTEKISTPQCKTEGAITTAWLPKEQVGEGCDYVDFLYDCFRASVGDEGYFVLPLEAQTGIYLTRFSPRADTEYM